jgi:hypothetical protein
MTIQAFRKALCRLPLSQEERASLTTDELFVLVRSVSTLETEARRRDNPLIASRCRNWR